MNLSHPRTLESRIHQKFMVTYDSDLALIYFFESLHVFGSFSLTFRSKRRSNVCFYGCHYFVCAVAVLFFVSCISASTCSHFVAFRYLLFDI